MDVQASNYRGIPDLLVKLFGQVSLEFISCPRVVTKHGHLIMTDDPEQIVDRHNPYMARTGDSSSRSSLQPRQQAIRSIEHVHLMNHSQDKKY